jgi:hypothetical protein
MEDKNIYAVSTIGKRDFLVKRIRDNLMSRITPPLKVVQPQINKLQVLHYASEGVWIVVKTYLVIVTPLIVDTVPLQEAMVGNCTFHVGGLIKELEEKIKELRLLSGHHTIEESKNETFIGLVNSLSNLHGENRTGCSV